MVYLRWIFWISFWTLVAAVFHYTLPQKDIVRITNTYEKRVDFGENSIFWASPDVGNDTATPNRDVFFIQTVQARNGRVMVYRNEDTGWDWPPYFKFDTANLQAEASDLKSTAADPKWVMIRHYGWRNEFLSIYPNAVELRAVPRPDTPKGVPWINICIIAGFLAVVGLIWLLWRRFRAARIDPVVEDFSETWDAAGDLVARKRGRISRWLDTWRPKDKRRG